MGGGLLQLVAKNVQDIYLTDNPTITFFKTVFRRHTNFSKNELDLTFASKLDFGKESYCKIERFGDLIHRLYLVITLPKINIIYRSLKIEEVQNLLRLYDIIWVTSKEPSAQFTSADFLEVQLLIQNKIATLRTDLTTINQNLRTLTPDGKFHPSV